MKKELRLKVYNKYKGHCAYCGRKIEYKGMQIDHIASKFRSHLLNSSDEVKNLFGISLKIKSLDDFENLNPSCRRCNFHKSYLGIEDFRKIISRKLQALNKDCRYKIVKDFGMITEHKVPIVFYFEREEG